MQNEIVEVIEQFEKEHGLEVVFAVESGSRVWGFESEDSDYDVRGVHRWPVDDYLKLPTPLPQVEKMVTVGAKSSSTIDIVTWDVKKFLSLMLASNSTVSEWLSSERIYKDSSYRLEAQQMFHDEFSPNTLEHHYLGLARHNYEKYVAGQEQVNLKKYVYVLRAIGCIEWLRKSNGRALPPLDWVFATHYLPDEIQVTMRHFVQLKRSTEHFAGLPIHAANDFIEAYFKTDCQCPSRKFSEDQVNDLAVRMIRRLP